MLDDENEVFRLNARHEAAAYLMLPTLFKPDDIPAVFQQAMSKLEPVSIPKFDQHKTYGLYLPIQNNTHTSDWMLHINRFLIDRIEIYVVSPHGNQYFTANFLDRNARDVTKSVFGRGVPLNLPVSAQSQVFVVLFSNSYVPPVSVDLYSEAKYQEMTGRANTLFIFTMGIVFSSIAASFLCFLLLRESTFFWFAISSSLMAIITLSRSYIGITFFEPNNRLPDWFWLLICAAEVCLLKFVVSFLSSDKDSPLLRQFYSKGFIGISASVFISLVLSELFLPAQTMVMISIFFGLIIAAIAIGLGAIYAFKRRGYYILFSLGWLPILYRIGEKAIALNIDPTYSSEAIVYNPSYDPIYQAIHFFTHLAALLLRVVDQKQRQQESETKSLAKTMFLASVSHDLRQPIHSMQLLTSHLEKEVQSQQGKSVLGQLQRVQGSFDRTFNALMDWSQLEAGKVNINLEKVDISKILQDIKAEFTSLAIEKGIELRIQTLPYVVTTDPILLNRILRNLISNAVKYTQSGGVLIATRCRKTSIVIEVWDTGCGIADHEQPIIFDLYQRAKHYKDLVSGSGIGLANVKQMADALGYEVSLKSKLNTGTVFRLELPEINNCIAQKNIQNKSSSPSLTITNLIENIDLKQNVDTYLHKWGYNTKTSADMASNCIYFTDTSSNLKGYLSHHINNLDASVSPRFVGAFSKASIKEVVVEKLEIHRLNPTLEPAELRAFLRYVEAQYLSV